MATGGTEADLAYANAAFIPGGDGYPARWAAKAAAFRATARMRVGLPYGPAPRQRFDLFLPQGRMRGVAVFLHGGYWMDFGREEWSHLAAGAVARGWAMAIPSYTLAPEARVAAITAEVAQALAAIAGQTEGPMAVTGHSAGGHLAARMGCADVALAPGVEERLPRVVPISPLADLAPLTATAMNATLRLDAAEAAAESPARHALRPGVAAHVMVGGQERPAFLWQARSLAEAWACPWTVAAGRHHFDVIDALENPGSSLVEVLLGGL